MCILKTGLHNSAPGQHRQVRSAAGALLARQQRSRVHLHQRRLVPNMDVSKQRACAKGSENRSWWWADFSCANGRPVQTRVTPEPLHTASHSAQPGERVRRRENKPQQERRAAQAWLTTHLMPAGSARHGARSSY